MNTKALMVNADQEGGVYPEYKPFSPNQIKQFIGPYVLQGLGPSPQIKMKFKPQFIDPVNGNDLCYEIFGMNGDKAHKCFNFFACQNPMLPIPSKTSHPNFKIDDFIAHIMVFSQQAWLLGISISVDEQTIGFKGNQ